MWKYKFLALWFTLVSVIYGEGVILQKKTEDKGEVVSKNELKKEFTPWQDIDLNLKVASYVLIDASTGKVLKAFEEKKQIHPASLTKVLTLYLVAEALKHEQIELHDLVPISEKAWRTGGSKMFVRVGSLVTVQDLIQGVATVSGNDAAIALAEYLGGSEEAFAQLMNHKAAQLEMMDSHFTNASGLPRPDHYSTALDLAKLTYHWLKEVPQFYFWFKEQWFEYNGIKQPNRNKLLWKYDWIDGVKTGHTEKAGYCLIVSGLKDHLRLIGVLVGAPNEAMRNQAALTLLNFGFRHFKRQLILEKNQEAGKVRVYGGKTNYLSVGVAKDWWVTLPKLRQEMKTTFQWNKPFYAPVNAGEVCGKVVLSLNDEVIAETEIIALHSVQKGNLLKRMIDYFRVK